MARRILFPSLARRLGLLIIASVLLVAPLAGAGHAAPSAPVPAADPADPPDPADAAEPGEGAEQGLDQLFQDHLQKGEQAQKKGDHDGAIREFRAAYQLDAQPVILFKVARSYHLSGRNKEALELYQHFLKDEPGTPLRAETIGYIQKIREQDQRESKPLWKKGWFWGIVGGAVVVVGVGIGLGVYYGQRGGQVIQ